MLSDHVYLLVIVDVRRYSLSTHQIHTRLLCAGNGKTICEVGIQEADRNLHSFVW